MQNPRKGAKHPIKEEEPLRTRATKLGRVKSKTAQGKSVQMNSAGRGRTEEALQQSEEHFRRLYEQAPLGYQSLDVRGRLIEVNQAWLDLLGYTRDEVIGSWFGDFLAPHDVEAFRERFPRFKATGEAHVDFEMARRDGSTILVHIDGIIGRDAQGQFRQTHCILQDITDRKQTEETLREKQNQLLEAQRIAHIGNWWHDLVTGEIYWSDEFFKIIGREPQKPTKELATAIIHPDDFHILQHAMDEAAAGKVENEHEFRIIRPDGSIRWIHNRWMGIYDEAGKETKRIGTHQDITERKRAEETLRDAELRYRTVADFTYDWEDWENPDGTFCYVSPACERITGYPAKRFIDEPDLLSRLILPEDQDIWAGHRRNAAETRGLHEVQFRIWRPDGEIRWIEHVCQPVTDKQGVFLGYRGSNRDITERKQAEQERLANFHFFESMDRINRALIGTNDLKQMMSDVLDVVLSVFECDRASLVYPCEPEAATWKAPMERTRPEWPGALALDLEVPMDPEVARVFRVSRAADGPVEFGQGYKEPLPKEIAAHFNIQSQITMALYPKISKPWNFVMHQCSYPRVWTPEERRLLKEIGRRLTDGLSSLLIYNELQESEQKYRCIVDTANEGIWALGPDTMTTFINARMAEMLGYSYEEIISHPLTDFMFEEDVPDHLEKMKNHRQGISENYEHRFRRRDGQTIWTLASATPIFDDEHHFQGSFAMLTDITEHKKAEELLRESEARYRALIESQIDLVSRYRPDTILTFANDAYCKFYGKTRDELIGHSFLSMVEPEFHELVLKQTENMVKNPRPITGEYLNYRQDGEECWIQWVVQGVVDENGRVVELQAVGRDITERKQAEEALEYRRKLERIITEISTGFINLSSEEIDTGINRALQILGDFARVDRSYLFQFYQKNEMVSNIHEWCARGIESAMHRLQGVPVDSLSWIFDKIFKFETVHVPRVADLPPEAGTIKEECRIQGIKSFIGVPLVSGGRCLGSLGFDSVREEKEWSEDIINLLNLAAHAIAHALQRKQAEKTLKESELSLSKAQQIAHLGNWDWDVKNETLSWSEEVYRIFGVERNFELTYEGIEAMVHSADREKNRQFVNELLATANSADIEFRIIRPDGAERYLYQNAEVRRDEAGNAERIFGITQDITERKRAEEQLLTYQSKLKAMASQLSSIQERQRRQLAVELHDRVNQRLAMVKLGLQTLGGTIAYADAATKIKEIAEQVGDTMEDAYSLMLELSNPVLYEIGLKAAVDTLFQSEQVKNCGIECRLVAPEEPMKIDTDTRVVLYQTIRELLVNAIKHSKAKEIEVHLCKTHGTASVTVKDDGVGFNPSDVKPPGKEGGFGLFNIRENIGGMGGEFTIESKPGEGTSVTACVPLPRKDPLTQKGGSYENIDRR